eukprot:6187263-Pleurochrysis_carterae.AAC.1
MDTTLGSLRMRTRESHATSQRAQTPAIDTKASAHDPARYTHAYVIKRHPPSIPNTGLRTTRSV